ncbi:MAG: AAA family ATPase [Verrucomicrobiales bacterium]|nr:AAA family ATPase [Verrucomicrobiales bacterium]
MEQHLRRNGIASEYLPADEEARPRYPAPVRLGEWLSSPMAERQEIIRGLLRQGDKMTIGGSSKSYKTWLVSDLALCVSAGKSWMGFETVKSPVLFLNLELHEDTFHKRMTTLCNALQIKFDEADFRVWNLRKLRVTVEDLREELKEHAAGVRLIALDPQYKLLGKRKENDAGDMAELMGQLEEITSTHGCGLVVPAHYSKGNQSEKASIDRISGSGVTARDADAIVTLTAHDQERCFSVESTLRSFAPVDPFVIRWEFPLFRRDDDLDPGNLKKAGRPQTKSADDVLSLLPEEGMRSGEWEAAAIGALNISERTFRSRLKELKEQKKVTLSPLDDRYRRANRRGFLPHAQGVPYGNGNI